MELYSLHHHVLTANLDGVKALIARGVDLDELDEHGHTPLHWAVFGGYDDLVLALLEGGANPNAFSSDGVTPKWRAHDFGLQHIETLLAAYGGKVLTDIRFDGAAFAAFSQALGHPLPQVERPSEDSKQTWWTRSKQAIENRILALLRSR